MEYTGSGSNRILKADGASYLIPKNVEFYVPKGSVVPYSRLQARFGSCEVNGIKVGRGTVVVSCVKVGVTIENALIMRWVSLFGANFFPCIARDKLVDDEGHLQLQGQRCFSVVYFHFAAG